MTSMEERMATLEAKDAIRELTASYCHAVVRKDVEAILELFTEDGVFEMDGLAPGEALVEILSAEQEGGARTRVLLPAGWPLSLRWSEAAPVIVRLRHEGRQPVTTATLRFEPRASQTSALFVARIGKSAEDE